MSDINRATATRNLDAYYYGFDPTGCDLVDSVLEQVARAGKAFHSTDDWNEEDIDGLSPVDKMQAAANASAKTIMALIAEVEKLRADTSSMRGSLNANSKCTKKLIKDGTRAAKERDRLRAENEALRSALKPFADYCAATDGKGIRLAIGGSCGDTEIDRAEWKAAQAALKGATQ